MSEQTTTKPGRITPAPRRAASASVTRTGQATWAHCRSRTPWSARSPGSLRRTSPGSTRWAAPHPRAVGALRERIPGARTNHSQGVSVEVGETQAAVDIDLIADYGVAIADLAVGVRRNVISSIERMTGLQVTEVNISVADIHLPEDDQDDDTDRAPRVQ